MTIQGLISALRKVVLGFMLLIVSFYLLLFALNWQDEAASPESLQLQQILDAQQAISAQHNGYLYYQQHHTKPLALPEELRAFLQALTRCAPEPCLTELQKAHTVLPEWLAQQQPSLIAYQTLLNYPAWQYPMPQYTTELPPLSPLMDMQQLFLLEIWRKVSGGELASAKVMLQQDLNFWRQQLQSANSLLTKMMAVSGVKRHLGFATLFRQSTTDAQYQQLIPDSWTQPFDAQELSPMLAMAGEWQFGRSVVESVRQSRPIDQPLHERWLTLELWLPFLKSQATSNTLALSHLACAEQRSAKTQDDSPWYHWFYNPLGKILTQAGEDTCLEHLKPLPELEQNRVQLLEA